MPSGDERPVFGHVDGIIRTYGNAFSTAIAAAKVMKLDPETHPDTRWNIAE